MNKNIFFYKLSSFLLLASFMVHGQANDTPTLSCWGYPGQGRANVPAGTFQQVSAGTYHTCALKTDNTLACWGYNGEGQTNIPAGAFKQVSAGGNHTCALKTDNTLACWGENGYGQSNIPTGNFQQVSAGRFHTCAVKADNTLACWGFNYYGQTNVPAGTFKQVSAGYYYTCAVKTDNTLACWGDNSAGQSNVPMGTFQQVGAGGWHTCAVKTDNTLACWGWNGDGQTNVPAGTFKQVSAGGYHTCAVKTDNTLACWGHKGDGQSNAPAGTFQQVSAGSYHTCAIKKLLASSLYVTSLSPTIMRLSWNDNATGEKGFRIQRKTGDCSSTNQWTTVLDVAANTTSALDDSVIANTTYAYQIATYYGGQTFSPYSACVSATTPLAGTPQTPTGIIAKSKSNSRIDLSWKDESTDETRFLVQRKTNNGSWMPLKNLAANSQTYSDTSASGNFNTNSYAYSVRACNSVGCSAWNPDVAMVPFKPSNLAASVGTTVKLTWNDNSSNETGFHIHRKNGNCSAASPWMAIAGLWADRTSYSDGSVIPGSVYSYLVSAHHYSYANLPFSQGYSGYTNCVSVTAP